MNDVDHYLLEADGIRVVLDLSVGHIARFEVERDGRMVAPFHRAPWADDPPTSPGEDDAPHLARLSGDFFCAPFGASDVEPAPGHGWTANAAWQPIGAFAYPGGVTARFVLERPVLGAKIVKEFTLRHGHPFLYQRHVFEGGQGALPVASHAMVCLPTGGRMAFSPKRFAQTPSVPLEPDPRRGRFLLAYPAQSAELGRFPTADGGSVDLGRYPIGAHHEDFAMLVEADLTGLGWSAVVREQTKDLALLLKDPQAAAGHDALVLERRPGLSALERPATATCSASRTAAPGRSPAMPPPWPTTRSAPRESRPPSASTRRAASTSAT